MSDELDPEVAADLALREHTAATRPRMSDAQFAAAIRDTAKPTIIGQVPCRARCGAVVDWTEEAEQAFKAWNRILARRADAPLDKTRIVFCAACRARGVKLSAESNRKQVDAIAAMVRELKGGCTAQRERELLSNLAAANHPDVKGLEQWLRENGAKSGRRVRREAL